MAVRKSKVVLRRARFGDASGIFTLIKKHSGELVSRSKSDILMSIDRFVVAEMDGTIVATAAWSVLPELALGKHPSMELKSVAVDSALRGTGLGRAIVELALQKIAKFDPEQVILLTFVPDFFRKFGFQEVPKEQLMHKLYTGCLNCTRYDNPFTCPEIAMAKPMRPAEAVPAPAAAKSARR